MKKGIIILAILIITFASCKISEVGSEKNTEVNSINWTFLENRSETALEYETVGVQHNEMLSDIYSSCETLLNEKKSRDISNNYLTEDDISEVINNYFDSLSSTRNLSVSEIIYTSEEELDNELDEEAVIYINKIRNYLNDCDDEYEEVIYNIEVIEEEAVEKLSDMSLAEFLSYSTTKRASLAYWMENLESWDSLLTGEEISESRGFGSWLRKKMKKYKRQLITAASDAAGAALGARIGASLGGQIGAIAGAAVCGAASSVEAWKTSSYCVIVNLSDIKDGINTANDEYSNGDEDKYDPNPEL